MNTCGTFCGRRATKLSKLNKLSEDNLNKELDKIKKLLKCLKENTDNLEHGVELQEKKMQQVLENKGKTSDGAMVKINENGLVLIREMMTGYQRLTADLASCDDDIFEVETVSNVDTSSQVVDEPSSTNVLDKNDGQVVDNSCSTNILESNDQIDKSQNLVENDDDQVVRNEDSQSILENNDVQVVCNKGSHSVLENIDDEVVGEECSESLLNKNEDRAGKAGDGQFSEILLTNVEKIMSADMSKWIDSGESRGEMSDSVIEATEAPAAEEERIVKKTESRCSKREGSQSKSKEQKEADDGGTDECADEVIDKSLIECPVTEANSTEREKVDETPELEDEEEEMDRCSLGSVGEPQEGEMPGEIESAKEVQIDDEGGNSVRDTADEPMETETIEECEKDNEPSKTSDDGKEVIGGEEQVQEEISSQVTTLTGGDSAETGDVESESVKETVDESKTAVNNQERSQSLLNHHANISVDVYDVDTDVDDVPEGASSKNEEEQEQSRLQKDIIDKALEMKRLVLESSGSDSDTDSDWASKSKKKVIKKEQKKIEKRRKLSKDMTAEEKEMRTLLHYESFRKKGRWKEKSGGEKKKKERKKKEKGKDETLLDMYNDSDEGGVSGKSQVSDDLDMLDSKTRFMKLNNNLLKSILLNTSSDDLSESNSGGSEEKKKSKVKTKKKDKDSDFSEEENKKKKLRDPLLTGCLDSSEEETRWLEMKQKQALDVKDNKPEEKSGKKKEMSDSDVVESVKLISSSTDEEDAFIKKRKKPSLRRSSDSSDSVQKDKKRRRILQASDSSSSDEEKDKTSQSPKGRKNIRKMLKKDSLHLETREALKNEQERKKRIAERQKEYVELFREDDDEQGLVLDYDEETKEATVVVHRKLCRKLKPHQRQGIKFIWDNCFESLKKMVDSPGSGCILAHCMGLGKTLQIVALVHTLMTNPKIGLESVLVVCPLSTVSNWKNEFNMWLHGTKHDIIIHELGKAKKNFERAYALNYWQREGGVLIISYDMFRNLTKEGNKRIRKKKEIETFSNCLLDPGPDLVVCDEGHLLKNEDTALSKCMRRIKTSRRIVLTGTPLQNNLIEYHCMVQFVKPNILGTKKEFSNRFVNPINNGQFEDSTEYDVKIMKKRSHVLHSILDGCVQRFDYSVLTPFLPKKYEYVISIAMTPVQVKLYRHYLDNMITSLGRSRLFVDYNELKRIWTHPATLLARTERDNYKSDDDDEVGSLKDFVVSGSGTDTPSKSSSDDSIVALDEVKGKTRSTRANPIVEEDPLQQQQPTRSKQWFDDLITEAELQDVTISSKLVLLCSILKECQVLDEKLLVFSQSLYSLDIIEKFLPSFEFDGEPCKWRLGHEYFRLDGSTTADYRTLWCKKFNKFEKGRLFLISTKAGGLGINLVAANRVIVFDASWNPSHDVQSIFRVYRFGQTRPCYVYRFLAEATMEEKIYERQVTKLSLACRVVDELQIGRHYSNSTLQELYKFEPSSKDTWKTPMVPGDGLLADLLQKHKDVIVGYHEHDSLLENKEEEILTDAERKAAWEEYENEKQAPAPQIRINPATQLQQFQQQSPVVNHVFNNKILSHFMLTKNPMLISYVKSPDVQDTLRKYYNLEYQQSVWQLVHQIEKNPGPAQVRPGVTNVAQVRPQIANPFYKPSGNVFVVPGGPVAGRQGSTLNPLHQANNEILDRGKRLGVNPTEGENLVTYMYRVQTAEKNNFGKK